MNFDDKSCAEIKALIDGGTLSGDDLAEAQVAYDTRCGDSDAGSGGGGHTDPNPPHHG